MKLRRRIVGILGMTGLVLAALQCNQTLQAAEQVHIVKRSETLSDLARRYGVSSSSIIQQNDLKNPALLRPGQRLIIPDKTAKSSTYTVRRGDTVGGIARSHGLTVAALTKHNDITKPYRLVPGQTLLIPDNNKVIKNWDLPTDLESQLEAIRCSSRWKNIVIHHSGSKWDTPRSMDSYHRRRGMENGLAYHFVIGNGQRTGDGEVYIGSRWQGQLDGGHLASLAQNHQAIGICLVGDFNLTSPSRKQMQSLRNLIGYLMSRCSIGKDHILTHQEINTRPTECPGKRFPKARFLAGS